MSETQDLEELPDTEPLNSVNSQTVECFEFPNLWGTVIALDPYLPHTELINSEYIFGRDYQCADVILKHSLLSTINISKKHFRIGFNVDTKEAYIIDHSHNGTYVNNRRLTKNEKHYLPHLSTISVFSKINEAFIYLAETNYKEEKSKFTEDILENYFICKHLGQGSFGCVQLCVHKESKTKYALKRISNIQSEDRKYITSEVKNLKSVSHPNIIQLHESFTVQDDVFLFLEYMPDLDLQSVIIQNKKLNEQLTKCFVYQIASSLKYLHSLNIVHRDLKPANILLKNIKQSGCTLVKVGDFGLSKNMNESTLKSKVGTPMFIAPEVLFHNSYTHKVDVWSLGVIIFHCLSGQFPFPANSIYELAERLQKGFNKQTFSTHSWLTVTYKVKALMLKMITTSPDKRCDIKDMLSHPWIIDDSSVVDYMTKLGLTSSLNDSNGTQNSQKENNNNNKT